MSFAEFLSLVDQNRLPAFASLFASYVIASAIYNVFFHPLSRYPGPFWCKVSSLVSFYWSLTGRRHIWIWQCHQRYGSAFRYRPDGVLFDTPSAYRDIYNYRANVKKSQFYDAWPRRPEEANTLASTDKARHARKRRILNSVFSEKSLRAAEPFINQHVNRWIQLLVERCPSPQDWTAPINQSEITSRLIFDLLGDLCFGRSFETKEPGENALKAVPHGISSYVGFLNSLAHSPMVGLWIWLKPRGLGWFLEQITPRASKDFRSFTEGCVERRLKQHEEKSDISEARPDRKDMFHYLVKAKDPETGEPGLRGYELVTEALLLIIAGTDTTSTAMCGLMFYLTRNAHAYQRLTEEIRGTFASREEIRYGSKLSSLVYLRACINEALRMSPPSLSELSRVVLPGGAIVDGQLLPAGTRLGCAAWSLNYNAESYPGADMFRPERWIVDESAGVTEEHVRQATSCYFPFSSGPDQCVGKNLALLELTMTVAHLLYVMDVKAVEGSHLGEGASHLGWGQRNPNIYQMRDAYLSQRDGPMVQFRPCGGSGDSPLCENSVD